MKSQLLFLHGAGTSDKNITEYLQNILNHYGIQGYSFNFSGYGGQNLTTSSLNKRVQEAENAIKDFNLTEPLNICGSSMGGYIAIKLLEKFEVRNLILFAPAIYDIKAFNVPFGEKFSEIIRQRNSWNASDSFKIISNYYGKILIFIGDEDEVIPKELIKLIDSNLTKTKHKEIINIPECPHKIHRWIKQNKEWTYKVSKKIVDFLNS